MKRRLLLLLFLCFLLVCVGIFQKKEDELVFAQDCMVVSTDGIQTEKKIEEKGEGYQILAYYPYTSFSFVNQSIETKLYEIITQFKKDITQNVSPFLRNQLLITYDTIETPKTISYLFHILIDTGGAHPNTLLWTFVYDKKTNQQITLDSLLKEVPNLLSILEKESRTRLLQNSIFSSSDKVVQDMMIDGTKATKDNYQAFAFSKDGMMIFFPRYQIAPYSYGEFEVTIPYQVLGIEMGR